MTTSLVIAGVSILQDTHGRYNLNRFYEASKASASKRPGQWLKRKSTQELILQLDSQMSFSTCDVVNGGERAGTYVHELLAVSYAGWVSPVFQLRVNQAFLDLRQSSSIPTVRDPAIQMLIDMAVKLDEARTLAQEAKDMALVADTKAQLALASQHFLTIREYVALNRLEHQVPPPLQTAYGRWLAGYCLEKNMPVRSVQVADRQYKTENGYHVGTIDATLSSWLMRRNGQRTFDIVPIREESS